jgi:hypothetical protein
MTRTISADRFYLDANPECEVCKDGTLAAGTVEIDGRDVLACEPCLTDRSATEARIRTERRAQRCADSLFHFAAGNARIQALGARR